MMKTYTSPSGAVICIRDDYAAKRGSDAERRVIAAQREIAHKILVSYTEKKEREKHVEM